MVFSYSSTVLCLKDGSLTDTQETSEEMQKSSNAVSVSTVFRDSVRLLFNNMLTKV